MWIVCGYWTFILLSKEVVVSQTSCREVFKVNFANTDLIKKDKETT